MLRNIEGEIAAGQVPQLDSPEGAAQISDSFRNLHTAHYNLSGRLLVTWIVAVIFSGYTVALFRPRAL